MKSYDVLPIETNKQSRQLSRGILDPLDFILLSFLSTIINMLLVLTSSSASNLSNSIILLSDPQSITMDYSASDSDRYNYEFAEFAEFDDWLHIPETTGNEGTRL